MVFHAAASSPTSVTLVWQDVKDQTPPTYELQREQHNGPTWATIATPKVTDVTYVDASVAAGGTYGYRIRSVLGSVPSIWSASAAATTPAANAPTQIATPAPRPTPIAPVTGTPAMLCGYAGTPATMWTVAARNPVLFDVTPLVNVETDDCVWSTPGATAVLDPTTGLTGSPDGWSPRRW